MSWKGDIITKSEIDRFFLELTKGRDFYTFRYFIKNLELERDSNHMIRFTRGFPYLNSTKDEALLIDCILENIRQHPVLGQFKNEIHIKLQFNFPRNKLSGILKGKRTFDLAFPDLGVLVEIDEKHKKSERSNDELKSSYVKINGMVLFRIKLDDILSAKRCGRGKSFSDKVFNNPDIKKILDDILSTLLTALCIKEKK
ncbi:MAG: hypothetical protein ACRCZI_13055 [Cetobacterium sp.]